MVEVPYKTEPDTLSERLARFDVGLSAVGVEHRPNGEWSVMVHPLALESVRRREVRLLKPLVNWKYVLTTLERMRRYAEELSFSVPADEEAEVWRVFEAQDAELRAGLDISPLEAAGAKLESLSLRAKLAAHGQADLIETRRGFGYVLD